MERSQINIDFKGRKKQGVPQILLPYFTIKCGFKDLDQNKGGMIKQDNYYVEEDQTGFVRGRIMRENIRTLMNIMNKVQEDRTSVVLAFLDAEKAFDRIECVFLKKSYR